MSLDVQLSPNAQPGFLRNGITFVQRQQRDWKVTVARTSLDKLACQMVFPYLSIYIVALGASATQLGVVNSIGMIIAGLSDPFTGWLMDRIGPKKSTSWVSRSSPLHIWPTALPRTGWWRSSA